MLPKVHVAPADSSCSNVEKNLSRAGLGLGLLDEMDFMGWVVEGGDVGSGRRFLSWTQDPELWML